LKQKPKRFDQWRLHTLIALLLDTGVRIEEALSLNRGDVDLDNLLVTVFGKGRKERRVPFSFELRKVLFRYEQVRARQCAQCERLFPRIMHNLSLGSARQVQVLHERIAWIDAAVARVTIPFWPALVLAIAVTRVVAAASIVKHGYLRRAGLGSHLAASQRVELR
jgi:integrase